MGCSEACDHAGRGHRDERNVLGGRLVQGCCAVAVALRVPGAGIDGEEPWTRGGSRAFNEQVWKQMTQLARGQMQLNPSVLEALTIERACLEHRTRPIQQEPVIDHDHEMIAHPLDHSGGVDHIRGMPQSTQLRELGGEDSGRVDALAVESRSLRVARPPKDGPVQVEGLTARVIVLLKILATGPQACVPWRQVGQGDVAPRRLHGATRPHMRVTPQNKHAHTRCSTRI